MGRIKFTFFGPLAERLCTSFANWITWVQIPNVSTNKNNMKKINNYLEANFGKILFVVFVILIVKTFMISLTK